MRNSKIFNDLLGTLKEKVELLPDKPEETYESTLSALWLLACNIPVSAEQAMLRSLPGLDDDQLSYLKKLISKRIDGVPLAHITGRQQFLGVELITNGKALIPRKETEILGNAALKILEEISGKKKEITAFDLCCGAGNLAVSLSVKVPEVIFYASDLSEEAVELARENIVLHGLENRIKIAPGSVFQAFDTKKFYHQVDLIICNPPYISDSKVPKMAKEISDHEPDLAFNGGMLGLAVIRELIRNAARFLKDDGWLLFEVGLGQGDFVKDLCARTALYREIDSVTDTNGNIRVIKARK